MASGEGRLSLCPRINQRLLTSSPTMVCGELCHWSWFRSLSLWNSACVCRPMLVPLVSLALCCAGLRPLSSPSPRPFSLRIWLINGPRVPLDSAQPTSGLVAQSVEQRPFKPLVLGSSPSQPTTSKSEENAENPCKIRAIRNSKRLPRDANGCKPRKTVAQKGSVLSNFLSNWKAALPGGVALKSRPYGPWGRGHRHIFPHGLSDVPSWGAAAIGVNQEPATRPVGESGRGDITGRNRLPVRQGAALPHRNDRKLVPNRWQARKRGNGIRSA